MYAIPNRNRRAPEIAAAVLAFIAFAGAARADIFQWEYIDPADPSQGKRQSTTLAPDGAGVDAAPGANLSNRDLTMAYLIGADLKAAVVYGSILTNADLSQSNLTDANFSLAWLIDANFAGAEVRGASFSLGFDGAYIGSGLTLAQLYSTASYQAHDLSGIGLGGNFQLAGGNFAGQNLTNANFGAAALANADLTNAEVRGANLGYTGITPAQLYSTASYQVHDLTEIGLSGDNLSGASFAGQNLTAADFYAATLTGADFIEANLAKVDFSYADLANADFAGAEVRGANFTVCCSGVGTGISLPQLYSTASYQARNLSSITLREHDLSGANLAGQNLSDASFHDAKLTGADFTGAQIRGAYIGKGPLTLEGTGITLGQLYSTANYRARDLVGVRLFGNRFDGGDFADQDLAHADLSGSTLTGADFAGANIRGTNFAKYSDYNYGTGITLAQLYSTTSYQARDLNGINLTGNDLAGANFAKQDLANANFVDATLAGANFSEANLTGAAFNGVSLTDADFREANLAEASFAAADLTGANFAGQDLRHVEFSGATLSSADLTGADVRVARFAYTNLTIAQLYATASYQVHDLSGIDLSGSQLTEANFAGQNLAHANLADAALTGADFTGADVRGANLDRGFLPFGTGITLAQLYSTASYQAHDLSEITLNHNDLSGGNFAGQNLANAYFQFTKLAAADFTGADLRGAYHGYAPDHPETINDNSIRIDGHIDGLELDGGAVLVVRDYDGNFRFDVLQPPIAITVEQHLAMGPSGTLRMVFEADAWDSTISFAPGIPVTLGGTLELTFAGDENPASRVGRTFDLFDWSGVTPTGVFAVSSPYTWDLSNLYTTGEVTVTAIPEPASFILTAVGLLGWVAQVRRPTSKQAKHRRSQQSQSFRSHRAVCLRALRVLLFGNWRFMP
jgi:uncharacterized protein YjbI with pentapeptide repeats